LYLDLVDWAWPHAARSAALLDTLQRLSAETASAASLTSVVALVRTVATAAYLVSRVATTVDV
jgi:hypothetical protein